jgi:fructose-specific phosphotransferase system IIC component
MYSRLNLIFNELNYINITNLGYVDIVMKTIFVLRHNKYVSIITVLHNMENSSMMILGFVIGKLVVFDIS